MPNEDEETRLSTVVGITQRARSSEQKARRRDAVLEIAEAYFLEVGYESFSMAQLAKRAGIGKGTLYLYFATREELFLTLYEESLVRWSNSFLEHLRTPVSHAHFAYSLYSTAMADGTFVPLLTRLEHVIEHNVTQERIIESKRVFIRQVDMLAAASAASLSVSPAQAREIVKTLGVLLIGAARSD
ncbi:MAG: TetR/AcrR family transcriptional regulator, partial [Pseudomonadales bacterium]|nr:TetR/AcrR family transcriptional regulator [Pseudomonadales bacterium]